MSKQYELGQKIWFSHGYKIYPGIIISKKARSSWSIRKEYVVKMTTGPNLVSDADHKDIWVRYE